MCVSTAPCGTFMGGSLLQAPEMQPGVADGGGIEARLDVHDAAAFGDFRGQLERIFQQPVVRHRQDEGVGNGQLLPSHELNGIFPPRILRVDDRIVHRDVDAVALELLDDVDDAGVAQVRHVLLERQAKYVDARAPDRAAALDHQLHRLLRDVAAHAVVDAAAGEDHFRVVAGLLGFVGKVVGIDADAMPADQARAERQEVPFGAGDLEHLDRVESKAVKDDRQLVDEGDVEIALRVLDHLRGFRRLDARGAADAGGDYPYVDVSKAFRRGGRGGRGGHKLWPRRRVRVLFVCWRWSGSRGK